ncbi:hypothetical protein AJ80_02336 [Polytolypa hystricis UAMH7299]|uniref:DUF6594 domain-containing protein n=1 Tax=Polytolypa hystricis (strain UAMH7299) TaxID=1447883 RepID=A0A2B7YPH1_POLH7|nr:hypothetical protein AJ80_02336 [Polytolypa hystricis UAMH7299]
MNGANRQTNNGDTEHGRRRDGYPALASWISSDPDDEGFIFRRFSRLSARNLLNLQSQLISIEKQLDDLDSEGRRNQDVGLRRWETFEQQVLDLNNENAQKRKNLYDTLEEKIKAYPLQASISNLRRPRPRMLAAFQDLFHGRPERTPAPILNGRAMTLLDNPHDIVALRAPADEDILSRTLQDHWPFPVMFSPGFFLVIPARQLTVENKTRQSDSGSPVVYFEERHVILVVAIISLITAAILLVGAIVSVYVVQNPNARLAMIASFTALFATTVTLMTNARGGELFAASAAYAAVLVVFVSGDLG